MSQKLWTQQRIEDLKVLWSDPSYPSLRDIGALLGCTRSAIAGACRRYGLPLRGAGFQSLRKAAEKPERYQGPPRPKPRVNRAKPKPLAKPRLVGLEDLTARECRYAFGDGPFTFCGHEAMTGSSYCSGHSAVVHQPGSATKSRNRQAKRAIELAEKEGVA